MSGHERYDVDGRWQSIAVRATIDIEERTFTLEETEANQDDGAEAPSPGLYVGILSDDGRRIRSPLGAVRGCEPELVLDADVETAVEDPMQALTETAGVRTVSHHRPLVD